MERMQHVFIAYETLLHIRMQPFILRAVTKDEKRPRGRPPTGRLRVLLKLTPEADKLLYRAAAKERITKSEFAAAHAGRFDSADAAMRTKHGQRLNLLARI